MSVLDIENELLFKNLTKSLKKFLSASFIKEKKVQSNIKKSVLGYLCHSHWAHVLSPSFLLIIPSWVSVIHLVPRGIGHFSHSDSALGLNTGYINCDAFSMSVLHPDFETVFLIEERITNPGLKSLSKAQHCLLKGEKNLKECLFKTMNSPRQLLVSFLDLRGHDSFPLQTSSSTSVCWLFYNWHTSPHFL